MNTIITAGHTLSSYKIGGGTGAKAEGRDEAFEARRLVNDILNDLRFTYGIHCFTDQDHLTLNQVITWLSKEFVAGDLLIDVHFNASASKNATGAEVLVADNATVFEKKFAKDLSAVIAATLGIRDRGLKTEGDSARGKLGILSSSRIANFHNFLIEVCFLTTDSDWDAYQKNYTDLVLNISKYIAGFIQSVKE